MNHSSTFNHYRYDLESGSIKDEIFAEEIKIILEIARKRIEKNKILQDVIAEN